MDEKLRYHNTQTLNLENNKGYLNWWAKQIKKDVQRTNLLQGNNILALKEALGPELFKMRESMVSDRYYWKYNRKDSVYYIIADRHSTKIELIFWGLRDEFLENPRAGLDGALVTGEILDVLQEYNNAKAKSN